VAEAPHMLVLGAKGLGRTVAEHMIGLGWTATGVSRTQATADSFPGRGVAADVSDPEQLRGVVEKAGAIDLAVNAISPKGRFGGGDLITTDERAMSPYLEQLLPAVFSFFRAAGASMAERGSGTIIQVTGGSARRALPGRAPWAAGAAGTRALSQAAANELKPQGVHVCLLVCDGSFGGPGDDAGGERIDTRELAKAVQYLHEQGRSAWTHELVVTPIGDRWTP
jgi:NAD(P)-dependent dehydrogenase (short-subunit alcohol dehydrogenase family)